MQLWKKFDRVTITGWLSYVVGAKLRLDINNANERTMSASLLHPVGAPTSKNTAGPVTLTAAEVLSGVYVRDPNGAGRTDTFPTAALLVAAIPGVVVGDQIKLDVINGADAAEVLTLAAGTGGAFDANQTAASRVVAQNASKSVRIRITNVTPGSEAYVIYA